MKKTYLLAGSLSLLGLAAAPVMAADSSVNEVNETTAVSDVEQPLLLADQSTTTSVSDLMGETEADSVGQVTSVSQLSDVRPTDWAFQALQSLVERYGCIAGYPNGTFRGNRSATRYEMAAALNACLDQISDRFASKADLDAVKALQDEFAAELATLRGRVDGLESRVATVEAQQFSTTTKLQGEVVMAGQFGDVANGARANFPVPVGGGIPQSRASLLSRVRLNFNTSFSGDDLLQTQLEVGNNGADFFSATGVGSPAAVPNTGLSGNLAGNLDLGAADFSGIGNTVTLRRLAYSFKPIGDDLTVTVGTNIFPSDFIDFNSYANNSAQDFSSGFFINNPLIINDTVDIAGGAGAAVDWNLNGGPFSVRALYIAANGNSPVAVGAGGGLGFGNHQASVEFELADSFGEDDANSYAVRLQGTFSEGNSIQQTVAGINGELSFGQFGVFGRYGVSINPQNEVGGGTVDVFGGNTPLVHSWMAGAGVKDLLIPGSLLGAAVGQPFLDPSVANGGTPFTQWNAEGFYRVPVNENITITPAVMYIGNPGGATGSDIIQGLVRATFSF
ncbi:MAG: iron uptake porin [Leptolyngbyaceae cyanobacterium MAG.088]|nr:iron uptake porin [Leptolyngbyaceae cyanobacterium MAG.088]